MTYVLTSGNNKECSETRYLPLPTGQRVAIDPEDLDRLSKYCWRFLPATAQSTNGYAIRTDRKTGKTIRMHREILGAAQGTEVDHIDGDGLNNRRANLRLSSRRDNLRNRRKFRNCTSRYRGVSKHPSGWLVHVADGKGKAVHVGLFQDEIDAAHAYDAAALERYGAFARLNFPDQQESEKDLQRIGNRE